jgi:endonuclease/exonuclease/phosphatase family metal-dependent hydrolase
LGNRKKLIGQANRLRERLEGLMQAADSLPIVVLGDMNDGPGYDAYEMKLGKSFVETAMGSVFDPGKAFHNVLWWMTRESGKKDELWTMEFPDPIGGKTKDAREASDHFAVYCKIALD